MRVEAKTFTTIIRMTDLPTITIKLVNYNLSNKFGEYERFSVTIPNCLVDSGTNRSILKSQSINKKIFTINSIQNPIHIENCVGQISKNVINEYIIANVFLEDNKGNIELPNIKFLLTDEISYNGIIGMDILKNLKLDFKTSKILSNRIKLKKDPSKDNFPLDIKLIKSFLTPFTGTETLINDSEIEILPGENVFIKYKVFPPKIITNKVFIKPHEKIVSNNLVIPNWINNHKFINILNLSANTVILQSGTILGFFDKTISEDQKYFENSFNENFEKIQKIEINNLVHFDQLSKFEQKCHLDELDQWRKRRENLVKTVDISEEMKILTSRVPLVHQENLMKLLKSYNSIFSRSSNDVGMSKNYLVELNLIDPENKTPIFSNPYKLDFQMAHALEQKIQEMLKMGILEKTSSQYNSPIMGILKADKSIRMVHNYSAGLNQRLVTSKFPVIGTRVLFSEISRFIHKLKKLFPSEKIYFSTLDVRNGFYSLSLRKNCRELTSFILSSTQLCYKRLPQGINISPSEFSRFMNDTFSNTEKSENYKYFNFVDDLLIIGIETAHIDSIKNLFEITSKKGLILALNKCLFFQDSISYLGYDISAKGIKAKKTKVEAILKLKYPTTCKEAQKITGFLNYFSRYIPRLSFYLSPLSKEIGKKDKFKLNNSIKFGIDKIKSYAKNGFGTEHLNYDTKRHEYIYLAVDSSLHSCGFVLGNCHLKNDKISKLTYAHFGSQAFEKEVQLLSSRARESIGASYALKNFSDVIPSALEFILFIDHLSITNLVNSNTIGKTSNHTRVRNAYAYLLNFPNMTIRYLPGKSYLMNLVDGLSRNDVPTIVIPKQSLDPSIKPSLTLKSNYLKLGSHPISLKDIILEQQKDPSFKSIFEKFENQTTEIVQIKGKTYVLKNKILHQTKNGKNLIVIPKLISEEVIQYIHEKLLHPGEERLRSSINNSNIIFKEKSRIIHNITRNCIWCQMSLNKFKKNDEIFYPHKPAFFPMQEISVDLVDISYGLHKHYVLTFLCKFSKFLDGVILKSKTAEEVTRAFILLFGKYQCEQNCSITSDNAKEFENHLLNSVLENYGIINHHISPYNSRGGAVERTHKELREIWLALNTTSVDFKFKIMCGINIYNTRPQKSLDNKSPNEIFFGFNAVNPLSFLNQNVKNDFNEKSAESVEDAHNKWINYIREIQLKIGLKNFENYKSVLTTPPQYEINDLVILSNTKLRMSKLRNDRSDGIFRILSRNLNCYKIRNIITNCELIRNGRFLKPLHVSSELKQSLLDKNFQLRNDHIIEPFPKIYNPSDNLIEISIKEPESEQLTKKYNLRKKK